jgi:hypothetical protein
MVDMNKGTKAEKVVRRVVQYWTDRSPAVTREMLERDLGRDFDVITPLGRLERGGFFQGRQDYTYRFRPLVSLPEKLATDPFAFAERCYDEGRNKEGRPSEAEAAEAAETLARYHGLYVPETTPKR